MNKLSFIISFRNLIHNPTLSFIKIAGLSVGVSGCVIVFLLASLEMSFDKFHPNGNKIYRLYSSFSGVWEGTNHGVPLPLPDLFRERAAGVEAVSQVLTDDLNVEVPEASGASKKFAKPNNVAYTDHNYFVVFQAYRWLSGTPQVLDAPGTVVLTESKARLYFGETDLSKIMGRRLVYRDSLEVTVAGIVADLEHNTDFNFTDFISLSTTKTSNIKDNYEYTNWGNINSSWQCFMRLAESTDIASTNELLAKIAKESAERNASPGEKQTTFTAYKAQPLSEIHFDTKLGTWDNGRQTTSIRTIQSLVAIALLLLGIAVINFVNLETAQALTRAREVGVRKVMGGSRQGLLISFISESFVVTSIAVVLSIPLAKLTIISFSSFLPKELSIDLTSLSFILFVIGLLTIIPLLSGIYPAMVLSSYQPVQALRMKRGTGRSGSALTRKALTVFQFTFSEALIATALIVGLQISWMVSKDLGFTRDAVITVETPWREKVSKRTAFRRDLEQMSFIEAVNQSSRPPAYGGWNTTTLKYNNGKEDIPLTVQTVQGDTSYLRLYGLKLIAGRNIMPVDSLGEILVNKTYCDKLGIAPIDMIGKDIKMGKSKVYHVVGVLRDFHHTSLHQAIGPWFYRHQTNADLFSLKLAKGADSREAMDQITTAWKKIYPDAEISIAFIDETLQKFYEQERRFAILANTATGLAIFISCLGLFGLASFTSIQRTKEIGIRKALGASVNSIMALLSREFLLLVAISFVLAVPLAWYAGDQWLSGFAYRMDVSIWIFLLTGILSLFIAFLTVGFQAAKAAVKNPVESLRYE
jgi:putative ABC transport system permease protein